MAMATIVVMYKNRRRRGNARKIHEGVNVATLRKCCRKRSSGPAHLESKYRGFVVVVAIISVKR